MNAGKHSDNRFNLEDRLLDYAIMIVKLTEHLPATRAGNHIAGQLLRSGTSPLSNHGEAEAAESRQDFIHKLSISLKRAKGFQALATSDPQGYEFTKYFRTCHCFDRN